MESIFYVSGNFTVNAGNMQTAFSGDAHCIDEGCYLVDGHCLRTIHAEMNAILQCAKFGIPTSGAEIYVTDFPCLQCTKSLLQAGIKKIHYLRNYHNDPYAVSLLKKKNIEVEQVKINPQYLESVVQVADENAE